MYKSHQPVNLIRIVGISNKILVLSFLPSDETDFESEWIYDSSDWLSETSSFGVSGSLTFLSLNFRRRGLPINSCGGRE